MKQIQLTGNEKILLIQLRKLGDVILSTPLAEGIKKKYPESKVYFLVETPYVEVLEGNPYIDGIIVRNPNGSIFSEFRLWREIAEYKFDIVIDILHNPRTIYYVLFSGAKWKIAFHNPLRKIFYSLNIPWENRGYSVFVRFELVEPLGIKDVNMDLFFSVPLWAERNISSFLSNLGINESDFLITLSVTSVWNICRWSKEYFAALADILSRELNAKVIFTYGPGEQAYVQETLALAKEKHFLSAPFSLKEFAALLKRANLHIGTNSGHIYVAIAQKTPSFTIYGGRSPMNWSPTNEPLVGWIQKGLSCQPCEARDCREKIKYRCLTELSPEEVFSAIKAFLEQLKNYRVQVTKPA